VVPVSSPQTLCESPGFSGPILFAMNQTQDLICYSFCNTYTGRCDETPHRAHRTHRTTSRRERRVTGRLFS